MGDSYLQVSREVQVRILNAVAIPLLTYVPLAQPAPGRNRGSGPPRSSSFDLQEDERLVGAGMLGPYSVR